MSDFTVELASLQLPDFGLPSELPQVPANEYAARLAEARRRAAARGLDVLVVYGDREHFANLAFLTGYDPRFEESLLVVASRASADSPPTLLVGNEGLGYAAVCQVPVRLVLYQTFSLLGQPRDRLRPLVEILREAGVRPGLRVGLVGWRFPPLSSTSCAPSSAPAARWSTRPISS